MGYYSTAYNMTTDITPDNMTSYNTTLEPDMMGQMATRKNDFLEGTTTIVL